MASPSTLLFETGAEWLAEARRRNIAHKSIKTCSDLRSGSKVTEEQFLLFRTLVPSVEHRFDPNVFGLAAQYSQAAGRLGGSLDFQAYLSNIGATTTAINQWHLDTLFKVPLAQQRHVCSTTFRDRAKLARRSESAVNTSLISFLQALTMVAGLPTCQWNGDRIPLEADFGAPAGSFIAVTDGQLQAVTSKRILALVECKRWERHKHSPQVEFQETAQMVSWIKEFPDPVRRPCYINGSPRLRAGHAKLNRFGPYRIDNGAAMAEFAKIIIAIMCTSRNLDGQHYSDDDLGELWACGLGDISIRLEPGHALLDNCSSSWVGFDWVLDDN
ncbi:hypothetical protein DTO282E5_4117 [Paecilomyces variotii]|nr:hypothetical protein DTO282E5_4117 [Paecilomyces variotii]